MSDVEIVELARKHRLGCPSDIGELRKLTEGFRLACEREGRPLKYDDEVIVTADGGSVTLTRLT